MTEPSIPRRLIVCVDGTWCHPDGTGLPGVEPKNITNVYRLFASVKQGIVTDNHGKSFHQKKLYFRGIGSEDSLSFIQRVKDGVFGAKCLDQIRTVYRECCRMSGPNDEVWLYGFSRGAYVVRAVAGLLHYIRALISADGSDTVFETEYKNALKVYRAMQRQSRLGDGQIHHMLATCTREAPIIRLVGAFDTVKAVNDDNLFDISLNDSIQNFRHALALNETRDAMVPECDFPQFASKRAVKPFLQAWFVGAHIDMGGSSAKDGLSLYPLQWILAESKKLGLQLQFSGCGGRARMRDPIKLVGLHTEAATWACTTKNGIVFEMPDIRKTHQENNYSVHLNRANGAFWKRKPRAPFDDNGTVEGFCSWGPQGTTIHPSVYLLLDCQLGLALDIEAFPFYTHLHSWRNETLGYENKIPVQGFWNEMSEDYEDELGAIRILVCGNSGVGKSSLINKVFGVEATPSSYRTRGEHNVREEIIWDDRPDLIIHDSRGFEAAGVDEFDVLEEFLKDKSNELDVNKRLHAIWFCLEAIESRPIQHSTEKLFRITDKYAQDIPIVVIATKKDEFIGVKGNEFRTMCSRQNRQATFEAMDAYASGQLEIRLEEIRKEINSIAIADSEDDVGSTHDLAKETYGNRFDLCIAVSKDDDESVQELTKKTAECFSQDRVRLLYIRAQVSRLDLKFELAVAESMRVYRNVLYSSTALAGVSLGTTTNRVSSAINLCQAIVNCFGVSGVSSHTIIEIYKANVVDDIGNSLLTAVAEATAALSLFVTIASAGTLPMFLVPMVTNIPLVVPTTARLLLMLTCDLILIFTRAFREASSQCKAQPDLQCIQKAASTYRRHSTNVHARVKRLIPHATGAVKCYQIGHIELGVKEILNDCMSLTTEYIASPTLASRSQSRPARASVDSFTSSSDGSIGEDKAIIAESLQRVRGQLNSNGPNTSPQLIEVTRIVNEMELAD